MIIQESTDYELIKNILTNPLIWALTSGQGTELSTFTVDKAFRYLLIIDDDHNVMGCFQIRELTKVLLEVHINLLPKYSHPDMNLNVSFAGFRWVLLNTGYRKVWTDVPEDCHHVIRLLEKVGWNQFGKVNDGIIYNNRFQNLLFYSYDIVR